MTINISQKSTETWRVNSLANPDLYTPSLIPLRERDWKALVELFDRGDYDEIEADIDRKLQLMVPEPPWGEEDPFDFLREYL